DSEPEVVDLHPHTLDEVVEDVRRVGEAVGKESRSEEVVSNLRDRIENVRRKTDGFESRRVAVLDWLDPVMVAGHWVPEMIEIAGGEYGMAEPGDRSEPREWSEVLSYSPEVLVAAPCGFDLRQTVENFDDLSEREGYEDLPAVRHRRVYAMDGHNYVNRPGPRIVDSLEYFAQILHPEEFGKPPHSVAQPPVRIR
ncbi:MAG: ABC transporter substrate-binding protein, partial [Halobacteria archaeon]|nr:ABC transporter substrate-binding protein [Halobacteria archaeon]